MPRRTLEKLISDERKEQLQKQCERLEMELCSCDHSARMDKEANSDDDRLPVGYWLITNLRRENALTSA